MLVLALALLLATVGTALAASTGNTGQPNQSCQAQTLNPGGSATTSSPGSPFNTGGVADGRYAGSGFVTQSNPNAVSQYDVSCFQVSQPHP